MQKGKQSLCFTEAPFIISTANIVGKKEGEGPLAGHFDVIGAVSYTHLTLPTNREV